MAVTVSGGDDVSAAAVEAFVKTENRVAAKTSQLQNRGSKGGVSARFNPQE